MRLALAGMVLLLAACSGDGASSEPTPPSSTTTSGVTTTPATTTTSAPASSSTTSTTVATTATVAPTNPPPSTVPAAVELEFDTRDGVAFLEVDAGEDVRITISSDATDEVHLHGYDVKADVTPDQPAVLAFTADTPGVFEIELESAGRRIAQLQVNS